jgi:uncharacterized protein
LPSPERGIASEGPGPLFVDSSAWIALFSARDQHHAEADGLFRAALGRRAQLITTSLVLAEVHRLLLFRAGVQAASAALDRLESSPALTLIFPAADHHSMARGWLRQLADRPLYYTDAVSFAVMRARRCQHALTFDQDFVVAGFRAWDGKA